MLLFYVSSSRKGKAKMVKVIIVTRILEIRSFIITETIRRYIRMEQDSQKCYRL